METSKTLLVILEQHFVAADSVVYTDVQCDADFWSRYLTVFDKLIVLARMRDASENEELSRMLVSSCQNVSFTALPDFVGALGPIKNYSTIRKTLKECLSNCDAVIFRMPSPISMVVSPLVEKSGVPFAAEMMMNPHTAYSRDAINHPLQPLIQKYITSQTKETCMKANGVSYVTERVLQEEYPCRAICSGTDSKRYFTGSYSTISLHESDYSAINLGVNPPHIIRIAHSGKMSDDRKGHIIFLNTIYELKNRGYIVVGTLIGDGPQRARFEGLAKQLGISDCCVFAGWRSGFSEVQKELQKSDFFVMPTKSEGLPRAMIEAMASGLLCFGNAVDGIPELLSNKCLSRSNSSVEYADMIEYCLHNWSYAVKERNDQFIKSKEYIADKLTLNRNDFYSKLRVLTEIEVQDD